MRYMWEVGKCVVSVCLRVVTWVCQLHNCNYNVCSHSINGCPVMGVCRLGAHMPCDGCVTVWEMRVWMHCTGVLYVCWVWTQECIWGWCGVHTLTGTCVFIQIYSGPASVRDLLGFIGMALAQAKPLLLCGWWMELTSQGLLQLKRRGLLGPFRHQWPQQKAN